MISTVISAILLYSTLVLDLATKGCFLDHQDTGFGPRKAQAPDVERLSSTSDAQSTSQNPLKARGYADLTK